MRSRNAFTRETRRIFDRYSRLSGWASGSAKAALRTSASDSAFNRFQSVAPLRSPDFAVASVVAVFFMLRSLTGGNYATRIFIAAGCDNKEDSLARHTDDEVALLSVVKAVVGIFDPIGILQGANGISKIHAV